MAAGATEQASESIRICGHPGITKLNRADKSIEHFDNKGTGDREKTLSDGIRGCEEAAQEVYG